MYKSIDILVFDLNDDASAKSYNYPTEENGYYTFRSDPSTDKVFMTVCISDCSVKNTKRET